MEEKQVLSREEMVKACKAASLEVTKRIEQFKPDKSFINGKEGSIQEQIFKGIHGLELMCSIKLVWFYPSSGATGRISQYVHVHLCIVQKTDGRFLRLKDMHIPQWDKTSCTLCGDAFDERHIIEQDTSLQEY